MSTIANNKNLYALFNDSDDIVLLTEASSRDAAIRKISSDNYFQCKYDRMFDEFVYAIYTAINDGKKTFHSPFESKYCTSNCGLCINITNEYIGMIKRNNDMERSGNDWYLFAKTLDIRNVGGKLIH